MTNSVNHSKTISLADLSNQIDVNQIFAEFRERLFRLGDLKRARNEHERRNWLGRWWHQGEMEQAQLDAQLLQAEFAETLAKLMAINLIQSQQLEDQQNIIGAQQERLALQNAKLKEQTEEIDRQQVELKKQGDELEHLVREFFELKGLTEGEARKLIAIANEVKSSKSDMYNHFDSCVHELREDNVALNVSVGDALSAATAKQEVALEAVEASFIARYDEHGKHLAKNLEAIEEKHRLFDTRLIEQNSTIVEVNTQLATAIDAQNSRLVERDDQIQALVLAAEQAMAASVSQTMLRVWWSLGIAISALALTLGSLIATHLWFG